ncbi:hypothetical protein NC998_21105 [Trichocoleus desertorum GB2-A4]|uniref:Uncharacterized protein n=2 Tax=Trichocoleus TaxID=450526 RepID=A0ABV0JCU9_9CYAN|nr:hypothetical protein [Trichocoleus sp. FACHB-46]
MLIGRRLIKNWGDGVVVVLEKLKPESVLEEGLYDVFQFDGEIVYRPVGLPHNSLYGRSIEEVFTTKEAWLTSEEVENDGRSQS